MQVSHQNPSLSHQLPPQAAGRTQEAQAARLAQEVRPNKAIAPTQLTPVQAVTQSPAITPVNLLSPETSQTVMAEQEVPVGILPTSASGNSANTPAAKARAYLAANPDAANTPFGKIVSQFARSIGIAAPTPVEEPAPITPVEGGEEPADIVGGVSPLVDPIVPVEELVVAELPLNGVEEVPSLAEEPADLALDAPVLTAPDEVELIDLLV